METFKVIITGATSFDDQALLYRKCEKILSHKINAPGIEVVILSGHGYGAECIAERWAEKKHLKVVQYPIDKSIPFKVAVAERDRKMIADADSIITFEWPPYPNWNVIRLLELAKSKGIPVRTIG